MIVDRSYGAFKQQGIDMNSFVNRNSPISHGSVCGGYAIPPTAAAQEARPILDKIGQLNNQIDVFDDILKTLEQKLYPVLTPSPVGEAQPTNVEGGVCELHSVLCDLCNSLTIRLERLERLSGRVRI